jgi:hypothetical protein
MYSETKIEEDNFYPILVPMKDKKTNNPLILNFLKTLRLHIEEHLHPVKIFDLFLKKHEPFDLGHPNLVQDYFNTFPLYSKIVEKLKYKEFIHRNLRDVLKVREHGGSSKTDAKRRILYYTLNSEEPIYKSKLFTNLYII